MSINLVQRLDRARKEREVLELEGELRLGDFETAGASVRKYLVAVRADVAAQDGITIKDDIIGLIDRAEHWLNKDNKKEAGVALAKLDRVLDAARDEISVQRITKFVGKGKSVGIFWRAVDEILSGNPCMSAQEVFNALTDRFPYLTQSRLDNSLSGEPLETSIKWPSFAQRLSKKKSKYKAD